MERVGGHSLIEKGGFHHCNKECSPNPSDMELVKVESIHPESIHTSQFNNQTDSLTNPVIGPWQSMVGTYVMGLLLVGPPFIIIIIITPAESTHLLPYHTQQPPSVCPPEGRVNNCIVRSRTAQQSPPHTFPTLPAFVCLRSLQWPLAGQVDSLTTEYPRQRAVTVIHGHRPDRATVSAMFVPLLFSFPVLLYSGGVWLLFLGNGPQNRV